MANLYDFQCNCWLSATKCETYGSSSKCSACGEKLCSTPRDDAAHPRMLWGQRCKGWTDRDANAALNLSTRGRSRLDRSLPYRPGGVESRSQKAATSFSPIEKEKGLAGSGDGERDEEDPDPQSRCQQVDSTARAEESTQPHKTPARVRAVGRIRRGLQRIQRCSL